VSFVLLCGREMCELCAMNCVLLYVERYVRLSGERRVKQLSSKFCVSILYL